ncbi:MAG: extracellular solute-binding protein [Acetobacter aceti]|nr:extracellular solute-binding protein [Acetobacter aceti]
MTLLFMCCFFQRAEAATHVRRVGLRPLVVATPAGSLNATLNGVVWKPFSQLTHQKIKTTLWTDLTEANYSQLRSGKQNWSLVLIEDDAAETGCAQGLFLPFPATASESSNADPARCGVPALSLDYALSWDSSRFSDTPTWRDFWDVARHPGKRGLRADPRITLEIALLADGVPPDAIYSTLGSSAGLDRAFRRLAQLRPYIVWWTSPAEAMHILTKGAALMSVTPTSEVTVANIGLPTPRFRNLWFPLLRVNYDWVIPANGTRDLTSALALATWATASEQQSALNAQLITSAPASAQPRVGTLPPAFPLNVDFWRMNFPAIKARFDQWLSQH